MKKKVIQAAKLMGISILLYVMSFYCWLIPGLSFGSQYGITGGYFFLPPRSREARIANEALVLFYRPVGFVHELIFDGPYPIRVHAWND